MSDGCPSQWTGRLINGAHFYIRFRHGSLTLALADTEELVYEPDAITFDFDTPDEFDGCLTEAEMLQFTGLALSDGAVRTSACSD